MTIQDDRVEQSTDRVNRSMTGWQHPPLGHATLDLVGHARACLAEAASVSSANERFAAAHLAALRAAAAVLAARSPVGRRTGRGVRRRQGPRNVWELLPTVAPELAEWSSFFAANAGKRAAAQAGLRGAVSDRDADDLLRESEAFLGRVCALIGLPHQEPLRHSAVALVGTARR
jgi:hypothetical protein